MLELVGQAVAGGEANEGSVSFQNSSSAFHNSIATFVNAPCEARRLQIVRSDLPLQALWLQNPRMNFNTSMAYESAALTIEL